MISKDSPSPVGAASVAPSQPVTLSPWINERFPAWEQLLSAHDVARLTRRPRWMVLSLTLLGRFPRKQRYHGRNIGWLRSDVLTWLARDLRVLRCHTLPTLKFRSHNSRQGLLPLGFARHSYTARRRVGNCMDLRNCPRRFRVRRSHAPSRES